MQNNPAIMPMIKSTISKTSKHYWKLATVMLLLLSIYTTLSLIIMIGAYFDQSYLTITLITTALIAVASVCMLNVQKQCLNAIRDQSISYQEAMTYGLQQYRWQKVLVIPCVILLYSVAYGCFLLLSMHISGTNLDNSSFWMTIMSLITDEHARTYSIIVAALTLVSNLVTNYILVCMQLFNYLLIDTNKSTGQLMKNSLALVSRINPMIIVVISLIECVMSNLLEIKSMTYPLMLIKYVTAPYLAIFYAMVYEHYVEKKLPETTAKPKA